MQYTSNEPKHTDAPVRFFLRRARYIHGAAWYIAHYEWTDTVNVTENVRSYQKIGFIFCNLKTNHLFD